MASQSSTFGNHLMELMDSSTSPEKALQAMSIHCLTTEPYKSRHTIEVYKSRHIDPVVIFLGYIKFIMTRRPDGNLEGIWEDIMRKTVSMSRYIYSPKNFIISTNYARRIYGDRIFSPNIFPWVVPEITTQMNTWLEESLSTHSKCSNPYIRLEMFRLRRLVDNKVYVEIRNKNKEWLCKTFIQSICEINPQRLHPSGDVKDFLFGVADLNYTLQGIYGEAKVISSYIHKDINRAMYLSHLIQLFGVISDITSYDPGLELVYADYILYCVCIFKNIWLGFEHIVSRPPIRHYLVEVFREFTAAVINNKEIDGKNHESLIYYRNQITKDLKVSTNPYDLPKLLLSRQMTGRPWAVREHGLLLTDLNPFYKIQEESEEDSEIEDSDSYTSDSDSSHFTRGTDYGDNSPNDESDYS